jgi:hypothetical protein
VNNFARASHLSTGAAIFGYRYRLGTEGDMHLQFM